jgi:hypothetical protein
MRRKAIMATTPAKPCPVCTLLDCQNTEHHVPWHERWEVAAMATPEERRTIAELLAQHAAIVNAWAKTDPGAHERVHARARRALDPIIELATARAQTEAVMRLFELTGQDKLRPEQLSQRIARLRQGDPADHEKAQEMYELGIDARLIVPGLPGWDPDLPD